MTAYRTILTILLLLNSFATALSDVQVTAGIESFDNLPNAPIQGTITITHDHNMAIDTNSFRMENKPLKADFIKDVRMSSTGPVEISFFSFQLPGKDPGLYMLPEVSVKVGNKVYKSIATTYEVSGAVSQPSTSTQTSSKKSGLKLEALVDAPQPFYPGQHAQFIYRFYFQGDIALTAETLPLLDLTGFQKVGDKVITDSREEDWSVQTIVQEAKAVSPGEFTFAESTAEGYAYQENAYSKKRVYFQPKLQATADPVTVNVSPLPANPPPTFTGAIGSFTFQTSLTTPATVPLEDRITVAVDVSSHDAFLSDISLPSLNQPGIKGLFRMSSLPSSGTVQGDTKRFLVDLYPLSTSVTQIPPLAFSYFDPIANQYVTLQSSPIPIKVLSRKQQKESPPPPTQQPAQTVVPLPSQPVETATPENLEISGNLTEKDLSHYWFGTWWGFLLIPLALALLGFQLFLNRYRQKQLFGQPPIKSSESVWQEAIDNSKNPERFYTLLNEAFLLRLKENGLIPSSKISLEKLPSDGIVGKVKQFLIDIQEKRFSGTPPDVSKVIKEASALLQELNAGAPA